MSLADALARHAPEDPAETADLAQIRAFVARHPDPFDRRIAEGHLTGSAIVVSTDGARTLLLHHRKLDRWLQPGGHADPGETTGEEVALREALEETGVPGLALHPKAPRPLDVDVHDIPARGAEPAHQHLDLRYLVVAPQGASFRRSTEETRDMRWLGWDEVAALGQEGPTRGPDSGLLRALAKARRIATRLSASTLSLALLATFLLAPGAGAEDSKVHALARDLLKELVEIPSTESKVGSTPAAEAMARRLRNAGFPAEDVRVLGPNPRKQNLVARIHGSGRQKPILLLAHLDVVEAPRADWSTDPFQLVEKDGFFYGRGTYDVKDGAALLAANFIRWKIEGLRPDRDLVLALTADEENGDDNGVRWLLDKHRDLVDSAYCLNTDGGDFLYGPDGRPLLTAMQVAEKTYVDWKLEVVNPGGHSSRPRKDNAIYQLASALERVERLQFPAELSEVVRAYFGKQAALIGGAIGADMRAAVGEPSDPAAVARLSESPFYNALLRTTCVATMVEAGHAPNALPQVATANVNCRVLPEMTFDQVRRALEETVHDPEVKISMVGSPTPGPASRLDPGVTKTMETVVTGMWPGLPVVPVMDTGASDGKWLRAAGIPTYGISGVFVDPENKRAHGKDERVGVADFYQGVDFYDRLVRALVRQE
jgi:acetylornithine deacetylase/succinyl-diaminopimelate desuccinylase-like protein/8-oxo-dGTP pyrophosphatase MutT (NUDIX family)